MDLLNVLGDLSSMIGTALAIYLIVQQGKKEPPNCKACAQRNTVKRS